MTRKDILSASDRPKKHDPAAIVKWANLATQQRLGILTSPDKQLEGILHMQKTLPQKELAASASRLSGVFDEVLVRSINLDTVNERNLAT